MNITKRASMAAVFALAVMSAACDPAVEETKNADMTQPVDQGILLGSSTLGGEARTVRELPFDDKTATLSTCKDEGAKAKAEGYDFISCLHKGAVVGSFRF